jgi:hypothetical protein
MRAAHAAPVEVVQVAAADAAEGDRDLPLAVARRAAGHVLGARVSGSMDHTRAHRAQRRTPGVQEAAHRPGRGRNRVYDADARGPWAPSPMSTTKRGNYESGSDYVLEYGDLRFTFNERDFGERVEQAAVKLGFVRGRLEDPEREDMIDLTVNGAVEDPHSALGEHVHPEPSWAGVAYPA